jgi:hypothetical protein
MKRTRRNARVDCEIHGRLLGRHGYVKGTVHNLSIGGLFFASKRITVDQQTEITFELGGLTLHAVVEVQYRKARGEEAGVGLRFLRLDPDAVSQIIAHIAAEPAAAEPA